MTVEYTKKHTQMAISKGYVSNAQHSSLAIMNSPDRLAITYNFISGV